MKNMLVSVASSKITPPPSPPLYPLWQRLLRRSEIGVLFTTLLIYIFFAFVGAHHHFISLHGTLAWLNAAAGLGIIALGVGLLMIAGEFDLSIGSIVGASSMLLAVGTSRYGINIWIMIAITFSFAGLVGLLNGLIVVKTALPSFIVTLATNFTVAGITLGLSRLLLNTTALSVTSSKGADFLFAAQWGQANIAILWWLLLTCWAAWILGRSRFGNWIFATGGNPSAAHVAGVPVARVKYTLFITTALSAALVGIIQTIEFSSGNAGNGQNYVLQAPIVAVIGGVLLKGGYGSAFGITLAAALYGIINVGIFYSGWNTDWLLLFLGILLLAAVFMNHSLHRLNLSCH